MLSIETLLLFNPTCEMAIANETGSYQPPLHLQKFEEDLATIPMFFASENDLILANRPSDDFMKLWTDLGFSVPQFLSKSKLKHSNISLINTIRPWGWTPVVHRELKEIKPQCSEAFKNNSVFNWNPQSKELYSRKSLLEIQKYINHLGNHSNVCIPESNCALKSLDEVSSFVHTYGNVLLKLPLAASGRGLHPISSTNISPNSIQWIKGAFKKQEWIMGEVFLDKQMDFSFQLYIHPSGEIEYLGNSYFINDDQGHFMGGIINWKKQIRDGELINFCTQELFNSTAQLLIDAIKRIQPQRYYCGPIGIDAIVYRNGKNELKLQPCLDINWRYNMGNLNLILNDVTDDDSIGEWKIKNFLNGQWSQFAEEKLRINPPIIRNKKLIKGFMPLIPINKNNVFGAWIEVDEYRSNESKH